MNMSRVRVLYENIIRFPYGDVHAYACDMCTLTEMPDMRQIVREIL